MSGATIPPPNKSCDSPTQAVKVRCVGRTRCESASVGRCTGATAVVTFVLLPEHVPHVVDREASQALQVIRFFQRHTCQSYQSPGIWFATSWRRASKVETPTTALGLLPSSACAASPPFAGLSPMQNSALVRLFAWNVLLLATAHVLVVYFFAAASRGALSSMNPATGDWTSPGGDIRK